MTATDVAAAPPAAGRNELGAITIDDSVVAKIASRAAAEEPDAGAAAPRLLRKSLGERAGSAYATPASQSCRRPPPTSMAASFSSS